MKKTGKVVFGVVSAAALVATGYASWSINKGFTQVSSNPISGTVTEILDNSFGKITLKENDTTLVFDAPKEYYNGTEDLEVSYFVKAHANEGEHVNEYNPYDLTRYDLVSRDYLPYLNISAEITDQNGDPLEDETKVANIEKIIDMPTVVIDYHEWLGEEAKNNADGYLVTYALAWDKETFGGVNPQIVYDNNPTLDVVDKKAKFQEIIDALKGVYFKLTFKVGFYGELPPVTTNVNTFDKLKDLSADDSATVEGRIITAGYNSVLLYDGTQFGFVNENTKNTIMNNFKVGDVVKATGVVADYYGYNYLSIYNAGSVVEASDLKIEDPLLTLQPTTWTAEELENFTSASKDVGKYVTVNNAKITISGNYTNFSVGDFTHGSLLFDSSSLTFENNKTYNLTGVMVYVNGLYKYMMVTSATEVEVSATKVAEVTLTPTKIKVGETATVTAKDDLGNHLDEITVVPANETQDVVEISGTTLKGLKAGEFKFTVTSGELEASNEMTLVVQGETTTPDEYTLVGEYKWDLGADFAATGEVVGTNNAESFSTVLLEKNTIANQTEIISFEAVNKAYYDEDKGAIKLGTSSVDGSFKINTVNQIKKIELTAYIWKGKTTSKITFNDGVETLSVASNEDGKAFSSIELELSKASNVIQIESSERIVITNIKLYK